jgi:hypothetical protein
MARCVVICLGADGGGSRGSREGEDVHHWEYPEEETEERYLGMTALQFNLAFMLVAGVIAAAAFLYFGGTKVLDDMLGGDEPVRSVGREATATPEAAAAASPTPVASSVTQAPVTPEDAAQAALLTIYDLPLGWRKAAVDDSSLAPTDIGEVDLTGVEQGGALYNDSCDLSALELPGEQASAESSGFAGPEGEKLSSGVSVFASEKAAAAAFETVSGLVDSCQGELISDMDNSLQASLGLSITSVGFRREYPKIRSQADELSAYRIGGHVTVESGGGGIDATVRVTFATDFVFVRSGSLLGGVFYFTLGDVDGAEEEALVVALVEKLAAADASLGG